MTTTVLCMISIALVYTLVAFNVYLTYRVLNVLDITCEASVSLGGCAYGMMLLTGMNPIVSLIISAFLGIFCGYITAFLINQTKIPSLLASIITTTAVQTLILKCYSYCLKIPLLKSANSPFKILNASDNLIIVSIIIVIIAFILYRFLVSEYGLSLRVAGSGKVVAEALGVSSSSAILIGLAIGNTLSGISGALMTQVTGDFNAHMGMGTLVFGLTAILLGERFFGFKKTGQAICACFMGCFVERILIEVFAACGGGDSPGMDYQNIVSALVLMYLFAAAKDRSRNHVFSNSSC